MTYRDLFLARFRSPNSGWLRFRSAMREPVKTALTRWRPIFAPGDDRPAELDAVPRDVPQCIDNVGRTTAGVLDARPTLARAVGISGDELRDLVGRREDCGTVAVAAGQIEHAATLASRDAAASLLDRNQQVLDGIQVALADANLPAAERGRILQFSLLINGMLEVDAHRSAVREQLRARASAAVAEDLATTKKGAALHAAVNELGAKRG